VAAEVLGFADEVDLRGDFSASGCRLCSLTAAADGIGRVDTARLHLARAVSLGKLANDALARSVGLPKEVRLLALLAWRSTPRSPEHLAQRHELSEEAFHTEDEPVAPKSRLPPASLTPIVVM
jgi:hypothetical protein